MEDPRTLGVLWYAPEVTNRELHDPQVVRKPGHLWVLMNDESPCTYSWMLQDNCLQHFNISAGLLQATSVAPQLAVPLFPRDVVERPPVPLERKNALRRQGQAPVLYVQSNCWGRIGRDEYVQELMKHIAVDSYGRCLHNRDLPEAIAPWYMLQDPAFYDFVATYKFTVAWENCPCDDYVTEKFHRPLLVGSVPLYYGAPNWRDWAPSLNAVIAISDFATPKDLADYVEYLDQNDTAYADLLAFKSIPFEGSDFQRRRQRQEERAFARDAVRGMCAVCDAVRRPSGDPQTLSQDDVRCASEVQFLGDRWTSDRCRAIGDGFPVSS
eukprot:GGOE01042159.1.p1 GENE.GGOE01042159.1~~GGOE01042159.1.p1  ORF type:complete len:325 (+),score=81.66 GGOE01042159.1:300-1274(+)